MTLFAAVALAGGLGALCRYLVDVRIVGDRGLPFPAGTFLVNISGSFAAGVLLGLAVGMGLSPMVTVVAGTGFLGAYTTFSTWMVEAARLLEEGRYRVALGALVLELLAGIGAAALGWWLAS